MTSIHFFINMLRIAIRCLTCFHKTIAWNIFLALSSLIRWCQIFTCLLINIMGFNHFINVTGIPIRVFFGFNKAIIRNIILLTSRSFFHRSDFMTIFFSHMTRHHLFVVMLSITILIFLGFHKTIIRNIFLRLGSFFTRRNFFTC